MTTRQANGASIRALREAIGIRHADFARKVGIAARGKPISLGYLTNIEKGRKQPAPDLLRAMADQLGVSLDAITFVVQDHDKPAA